MCADGFPPFGKDHMQQAQAHNYYATLHLRLGNHLRQGRAAAKNENRVRNILEKD